MINSKLFSLGFGCSECEDCFWCGNKGCFEATKTKEEEATPAKNVCFPLIVARSWVHFCYSIIVIIFFFHIYINIYISSVWNYGKSVGEDIGASLNGYVHGSLTLLLYDAVLNWFFFVMANQEEPLYQIRLQLGTSHLTVELGKSMQYI